MEIETSIINSFNIFHFREAFIRFVSEYDKLTVRTFLKDIFDLQLYIFLSKVQNRTPPMVASWEAGASQWTEKSSSPSE